MTSLLPYPNSTASCKTVLLIEPEQLVRDGLEKVARDAGWQAVGVAGLNEAECLLVRHHVDLVLLAAALTGSNYSRVVERLRQYDASGNTPIALLGAGENTDLRLALEQGITEIFLPHETTALFDYLKSQTNPARYARLAGTRALVLEDDRSILLFLTAELEQLGLQVDGFRELEPALASALSTPYRLALVDLVLEQGKSGNQFIRAVRQPESLSRHAGVIAVSGVDDTARKLEALRAGADAYLSKPLVEAELQAHILHLLNHAQPAESFPAHDAVTPLWEEHQLSRRERMICGLVLAGHPDKYIAARLGISFWTVRTHIGRIFRKCGVSNRIELNNLLRRQPTLILGEDGALVPSGNLAEEGDASVIDWLSLNSQIIDGLSHGIMVTDATLQIVFVNPGFARITGYSAEDALGQTPRLLQSGRHDAEFYRQLHAQLAEQDYWIGELWNRRKDGELYRQWINIRRLPDHAPLQARFMAEFVDLARHPVTVYRLPHPALHDALTGLANLTLLHDRFVQNVAQARRDRKQIGLLRVGLDDFATINAIYGKETGDQILLELSDRMGQTFRSKDTVSRVGGDEFVILLGGIQQQSHLEHLAEKLLAVLEAPFFLGDLALIVVTASIGLTLCRIPEDFPLPENPVTVTEQETAFRDPVRIAGLLDRLLSLGGQAMQQVKRRGGRGIQYQAYNNNTNNVYDNMDSSTTDQ